MMEKACLITGGTGGIGRAAAHALARAGMRVWICGRRAEVGERVAAEIGRGAGRDRVRFTPCDLASLDDVRALARCVRSEWARLDVLMLNAGSIEGRRSLTREGVERTFGVNHLAHYLLTRELLDLLRASAPARVVVVSSEAHRGRSLRLGELASPRRYGAWTAYQQSKLANLLFTIELARRLASAGVTANALHPGFVRTGFGQNNGRVGAVLIGVLGALFGLSPERGARTAVYLASAPEVEPVSGAYFIREAIARPSRAAQDEAAARALWDLSERLIANAVSAPAEVTLPG